jgi:hypothetical protein
MHLQILHLREMGNHTQQECQNLSLKATRMSKLELEIIHIYSKKMNHQVILHRCVHAVTAVE